MTIQRRRGQPVTLWPIKRSVDSRGNEVVEPDYDNPISCKASAIHQRSSRAEVPGQVEVDVYRLTLPANLEGVGLWSVVEWRGVLWDVQAPPAYRHGTRAVRHVSMDIRARPSG